MIETLYIEEAVIGHPIAEQIRARFPEVRQIVTGRYTEVFNRSAQNFRLQKRKPALILARKHDGHVLPAPPGYGFGGAHNFYFSHMLNCLYDCRYCFLQGMYRSANYVLFVNYEDFETALDRELNRASDEAVWCYSGYDCDSLALEPVTGFVDHMLPFFAERPRAILELRTKSTQIRTLLANKPLANVVVAFSFTPQAMSEALEHRVPSVERRIVAMISLATSGWNVGLRFDPLIHDEDYRQHYRALFDAVFRDLPSESLHSVSVGPFRLPRDYFRTIQKLYPDEMLFAGHFAERNGLVSYPFEREQELRSFCNQEILARVPEERVFACEF